MHCLHRRYCTNSLFFMFLRLSVFSVSLRPYVSTSLCPYVSVSLCHPASPWICSRGLATPWIFVSAFPAASPARRRPAPASRAASPRSAAPRRDAPVEDATPRGRARAELAFEMPFDPSPKPLSQLGPRVSDNCSPRSARRASDGYRARSPRPIDLRPASLPLRLDSFYPLRCASSHFSNRDPHSRSQSRLLIVQIQVRSPVVPVLQPLRPRLFLESFVRVRHTTQMRAYLMSALRYRRVGSHSQRSSWQVNQIFRDLASIVNEQGKQFESIEQQAAAETAKNCRELQRWD